jgi:methyl-accepting chemotaxis protein
MTLNKQIVKYNFRLFLSHTKLLFNLFLYKLIFYTLCMLIYSYILLLKASVLEHEDNKNRNLDLILECKRRLERLSLRKETDKKENTIINKDGSIKCNLQDLIKCDTKIKNSNTQREDEVEIIKDNLVKRLKDEYLLKESQEEKLLNFLYESESFLTDFCTNARDLFELFYEMPDEIFQEYKNVILRYVRLFNESVQNAVTELDILKIKNDSSTKNLEDLIKKVKNNYKELRLLAQEVVSKKPSPYDDKFLLEKSVRLLEFFHALVFIEYHSNNKKIGEITGIHSDFFKDIFRFDIEGYFIDQEDVKVFEYWEDIRNFVFLIESVPISTDKKETDDPLEELSDYFTEISKFNLDDILNPQIFKNIINSNIFRILDREIYNIDSSIQSIENYSKELVVMLSKILDLYINKYS